jgi:hypothetical protein
MCIYPLQQLPILVLLVLLCVLHRVMRIGDGARERLERVFLVGGEFVDGIVEEHC